MKFALVAVLSATLAAAYPSPDVKLPRGHPPVGEWQKAGADDARGPCPALNSLANHGHIPRDGRKVTFDHIVRGFVDVLGLAESVSKTLAAGALCLGSEADAPESTSIPMPHLGDQTDPDADGGPTIVMSKIGKFKAPFGVRTSKDYDDKGNPTLDLDELQKHNKIEHDASLVRLDKHFGDNWHVNPDLYKKFIGKSQDGKYLTVQELGQYRGDRYRESKSTNPEFTFSFKHEEGLAFGEAAVLAGLMGDASKDYAIPVKVLETFIGQERFPTKEEGWTKRAKGSEMGFKETVGMMAKLKYNAGLFNSKKN